MNPTKLSKVATAGEIFREMETTLSWFSAPRTAADYAEATGYTYTVARNYLKGWTGQGWLRSAGRTATGGRPVEHFELAHCPSLREFLNHIDPRFRTRPLPSDEAFLAFFSKPGLAEGFANLYKVDAPRVRRRVEGLVAEGRLHPAGKQRHRGPLSQAYCSDERKATLATVRWLLEEEARGVNPEEA